MSYLIESCCPSLEHVRRAVQAGTGRIELCEDLSSGGITPSEELIRKALAAAGDIPIHVLIRPRAGEFVYSEAEIAQMVESIRLCKRLGVSGVVIGALTPEGEVDVPQMRRLLKVARPLHLTFHRAFQLAPWQSMINGSLRLR